MQQSFLRGGNGVAVALERIPLLETSFFRSALGELAGSGARLVALFGRPLPQAGQTRLTAVLAQDSGGELLLASTDVGRCYPSFTPVCPQAHAFERELAEQWGLEPQGHPWMKPLRFQPPRNRNGGASGPRPPIGQADFYRVAGPEVHEVAVGPVHAGVIEPGHFRFQCHGEEVLHLEISLGYQHRGVERAFAEGPAKRRLHLIETLAGDTTIGHMLAHCEALEALANAQVPPRAQALRGIALELERMANHTGDLGALAGDVAFLPTASYCGRLRGDFLNMTALLCGNRFGRGLVRPGGLGAFDVDLLRAGELLERLARTQADLESAVGLLWEAPSVQSRFERTGRVGPETCRDLGLVGPAARACGVERDVRFDHPSGIFRFEQIPVSTWDTGDVFGRAFVRWLELQRSGVFVRDLLRQLPAGPIAQPLGSLAPASMALGLSEGWRGEICHCLWTDEAGALAGCKIVDPSFHNWHGLAAALRGQAISDFPLCNKSFNLSYCGHDL